MRTKLQAIGVATALLVSLAAVPTFAQDDHSKMGKMSGTKMSHAEMVSKIDKMSVDDKAAIIDEMPAKDRMAAMKASGHDASKMSAQGKADMFDKMPMDTKMTMMMAHDSMMQKGGKMGKMGKTGTTNKQYFASVPWPCEVTAGAAKNLAISPLLGLPTRREKL